MLAWLNRLRRDHIGSLVINTRDGILSTLHAPRSRPTSPLSIECPADPPGVEDKVRFRHRRRADKLRDGRRPFATENPGQQAKRTGEHEGAKQAHGNSIK